MSFALQMLAHTPPYVFAIFAALVWLGVRALGTRTQSVWGVAAAPAAFALVGLALAARGGRDPAALAAWFGAALVSASLGLATAPRLLAVDAPRRIVTRAGSAVPLLRNMTVFAVQYSIALAQARHLAGQGILALAAGAVSGASVGYTAGWALGFRSRYRRLAAVPSVVAQDADCRPPA